MDFVWINLASVSFPLVLNDLFDEETNFWNRRQALPFNSKGFCELSIYFLTRLAFYHWHLLFIDQKWESN